MTRVTAATADGLELEGWWSPPDGGRRTILYFHGNGGNIGDRDGKAAPPDRPWLRPPDGRVPRLRRQARPSERGGNGRRRPGPARGARAARGAGTRGGSVWRD